MEDKKEQLYSNLEGNVKDIMAYISQIEKERDDALKQVEEWNENDAVFEAKMAQGEAEKWAEKCMEVMHEGFAPPPLHWIGIHSWEEEHERVRHPVLEPEGKHKFNPNAPEYRYEFQHIPTLNLKCGRVTCVKCARKAFRRSLGIEWLYDRLCEEYDARHDFEEFV